MIHCHALSTRDSNPPAHSLTLTGPEARNPHPPLSLHRDEWMIDVMRNPRAECMAAAAHSCVINGQIAYDCMSYELVRQLLTLVRDCEADLPYCVSEP